MFQEVDTRFEKTYTPESMIEPDVMGKRRHSFTVVSKGKRADVKSMIMTLIAATLLKEMRRE